MSAIAFGSEPFPVRLCVILTSTQTGGPLFGVPFFAHAAISATPGPVANQAQPPTSYDVPLGTLATDQAGYVSFDLTPLVRRMTDLQTQLAFESQSNPALSLDHLWLHPYSPLAQSLDALDVENVRDFAVVVRLMVDPGSVYADAGQGFASIQAPSLMDWYLSPTSFSQMPAAIIGQDGCEAILPSNIATQEFTCVQLAPLAASAELTFPDTKTGLAPTPPSKSRTPWSSASIGNLGSTVAKASPEFLSGALGISTSAALALAIDYDVTWLPIGHGLGQILYSLPLAPGEQVNIAVIDWARTSTDTRAEHTGLSDTLEHQTSRDRTVGEVVDASIQEWQRGSSVMGGESITGGYGGNVGAAYSLGASFASTSGERNVSAETTQQLLDRFAQVSTSVRDLRSTVVIQSTQKQSQTMQTRTVRNHNHSHAMTLLYYEVLRHYRVVVERGAVRPALLLRQLMPDFTDASVFAYRRFLEPVLLLASLESGFDAIELLFALEQEGPPPPPPQPGDLQFSLFRFLFHCGEVTCNGVASVDIADHKMANPVSLKNFSGITELAWDFDRANSGSLEGQGIPANGPMAWRDIGFFVVNMGVWENEKHTNILMLTGIEVIGVDVNGVEHRLGSWSGNKTYYAGADPSSASYEKFPSIPCAAPPVAPAPATPMQALTPEQRHAYVRLMAHLNSNKAYYYRQIWLAEDPSLRYARLASATVSLSGTKLPLFSAVENRVLDVLGDQLVMPLDPELFDPAGVVRLAGRAMKLPVVADARVERLLSVPTRGVFGEAKLGHCNASEVIDNTRFWDWQTSPIPEEAPAITGIGPVSGAVAQNLTPAGLPASLLGIQQPAPAPDPIGLRAALDVLKTPGIFNNLSGLDQLKGLLTSLSDAAVKAQSVAAGVPAPATPAAPAQPAAAPAPPAASTPAQPAPAQTPVQQPPAPTPPAAATQPTPAPGQPAPTPPPAPKSAPAPAKPVGVKTQNFTFIFQDYQVSGSALIAGVDKAAAGDYQVVIYRAPDYNLIDNPASGTMSIKDPKDQILIKAALGLTINGEPIFFQGIGGPFDQSSFTYNIVLEKSPPQTVSVTHKTSESMDGIKLKIGAQIPIPLGQMATVTAGPEATGQATPTTGAEDTVTTTYTVTYYTKKVIITQA
ncbi:hypothetical protein [Fundidesulfovibrio terrae]|uniref:hypothetical protein n=1 Tax=Fundidesulfovibrio terrae TaxID=2922866 RepID=UPI001FAE7DA2|nr:hypothetical protein [Fundidesulfovibrio terrae]